MYGTLSAAGDFQDTTIRTQRDELGLKGGESNPCLYSDPSRDHKVAFHGDDVGVEGYEEDLDWYTESLGKFFEIEVKATLGPEPHDDTTATLLNRLITYKDDCTLWENDPRQIELAIAELGLVGAKPKPTPGVKLSSEEREKATPVNKEVVRAYRSVAARPGYVAQDRFDILYPTKECLRGMQNPTTADLKQLKHIGRCLCGKGRVALKFVEQSEQTSCLALGGTDYAVCPMTRRSTNGGIVLDGVNPLHAWSSTQAVVAMSSGEAELYGCVKAAAEGLGTTAGLRDLGEDRKLNVGVDSSAALGIVRRSGLGKLKHVSVRYLWIQEVRKRGELSVHKVVGTENGANLMTKYMSTKQLETDMQSCGMTVLAGRNPRGLQVQADLKKMSKSSVLLALVATLLGTVTAASDDLTLGLRLAPRPDVEDALPGEA